jgi:hypothetical protein
MGLNQIVLQVAPNAVAYVKPTQSNRMHLSGEPTLSCPDDKKWEGTQQRSAYLNEPPDWTIILRNN